MKYFIFFVFGLSIVFSQTAEQIVQNNLEATGGYQNWMNLQTVQLEGEISLGIDDVYPIQIYQKRPNLTLSAIKIGEKSLILEAYNGEKAIQNDFYSGKIKEIEDYQPSSFDSDLLNYKNKGFSISLKGKEKVNNEECFVIELTKNTNRTNYYISTKTYYVLKEAKKDETLLYSDFKRTENYTLPYKVESIKTNGETEFYLQIKRIALNKVIDAKLFNF